MEAISKSSGEGTLQRKLKDFKRKNVLARNKNH
jgi:hypothetical protein